MAHQPRQRLVNIYGHVEAVGGHTLIRTNSFLPTTTGRASEQSHGAQRRQHRGQRPQRHRQHQQDAAQERRPLHLHPRHHRVPPRARVHARPAPHHRQAPMGLHAVVLGRGAAAGDADQDGGRQEDDRGGRVHGLLAAGHRAGAPGGRQGGGHRHRPRVLRGGPPLHREGRHGAQGGLPRGHRPGAPGRAPRRGRGRGELRLRVRGRGQAQLRALPRAAAEAGPRRRHHHLRQHALGRHGGPAGRHAHVRPRHPLLRRPQGPQRQARRRPAHRGLPARHRRRRHHLPPHRLGGRASGPARRDRDPPRACRPACVESISLPAAYLNQLYYYFSLPALASVVKHLMVSNFQ
ncbi:hypothetical protein ACQJBY_068029 [Aegilops geniculata]